MKPFKLDKNSEYIEFTKICGDCGRKFKDKFVFPKDKKSRLKIFKMYCEPLACPKCSYRKLK